MASTDRSPMILFSGLAADDAIVAPQKLGFPNIIVPAWPRPLPKETLPDYCQRLAEELRPLGATVIGGVSFGGIIALEVAKILQPKCLVLISSVRRPQELPWRIRVFRNLLWLFPCLPLRWMQWSSAATPNVNRQLTGAVRVFRLADPLTLKWSIFQTLHWEVPPPLECPVYQLHGDRDFVFPISLTRPTQVVRGGGHLITLTHAREVNAFLHDCIEKAHFASQDGGST